MTYFCIMDLKLKVLKDSEFIGNDGLHYVRKNSKMRLDSKGTHWFVKTFTDPESKQIRGVQLKNFNLDQLRTTYDLTKRAIEAYRLLQSVGDRPQHNNYIAFESVKDLRKTLSDLEDETFRHRGNLLVKDLGI